MGFDLGLREVVRDLISFERLGGEFTGAGVQLPGAKKLRIQENLEPQDVFGGFRSFRERLGTPLRGGEKNEAQQEKDGRKGMFHGGERVRPSNSMVCCEFQLNKIHSALVTSNTNSVRSFSDVKLKVPTCAVAIHCAMLNPRPVPSMPSAFTLDPR
jgi:hypothetical protein